jgi:hypothetical protein
MVGFVPDTSHVRVCGQGAPTRTVSQYVHERIKHLDDWMDEKRDDAPVRGVSVAEWRETRSHDAIIARLMGAVAHAHTRTQEHVFTVNGTLTHTHESMRIRDDERRLLHAIEYRRIAKRYRRALLRNTYWGTLTRDGMALNATNTRTRLAPLDRAIALSDVYIAEHGHTLTNVRFARNATRLDDGRVDSAGTLLVARTRHTKRASRTNER